MWWTNANANPNANYDDKDCYLGDIYKPNNNIEKISHGVKITFDDKNLNTYGYVVNTNEEKNLLRRIAFVKKVQDIKGKGHKISLKDIFVDNEKSKKTCETLLGGNSKKSTTKKRKTKKSKTLKRNHNRKH